MAIRTKAKKLLGSKLVTNSKSAVADYCTFAKNNPRAALDDAFKAGCLLFGVSAVNSLNEIEDSAEVSAYVDVHEFMGS